MMLTIKTANHEYDILIKKGALKTMGEWLQSLWVPQKIAVISDSRVSELYAKTVVQQLKAAGFTVTLMVVPEGEQSKSLTQAAKLYEQLAEQTFTRTDGIVALGGGVIGDLAGFVASTYMRGIHFVQVPTSLLAQVDSSIGGKTGVNTATAKNLVGTFYQPDGVLIDPEVLSTLEPRRIREGIAEIVKSAAIADEPFWEELATYRDEFDLLTHAESVIVQALKVKQTVVEEDEFDNGSRLILNFGHTIGHAIEKTAGYGVVSHGEAVAIGMVLISQAAVKKQTMPVDTDKKIAQMLEKFHLPISVEGLELENKTLFQAIANDKKTRGQKIKIILLEKIGKAKIVPLDLADFRDYVHLEEEI